MEGFAEDGGGGRAGQDRARRGEARRDADCRGQIRFGHKIRTKWTIVWYGTGRNVVCMYRISSGGGR